MQLLLAETPYLRAPWTCTWGASFSKSTDHEFMIWYFRLGISRKGESVYKRRGSGQSNRARSEFAHWVMPQYTGGGGGASWVLNCCCKFGNLFIQGWVAIEADKETSFKQVELRQWGYYYHLNCWLRLMERTDRQLPRLQTSPDC